MDKPEALFLADELEAPLGTVIGAELYRRAAAELRRLHAQRDVLLEALKAMLEQFNYHTISGIVHDESAAIAKAHAAIKAVEETK